MTGAMRVAIAVLFLWVLVSAIGVIYAKHQSRQLFVELQSLHAERDRLNIEWGKLQLEQSTLATPNRIESIARTRLGMKIPEPETIVIVTP